jgi:hypothetical protein
MGKCDNPSWPNYIFIKINSMKHICKWKR